MSDINNDLAYVQSVQEKSRKVFSAMKMFQAGELKGWWNNSAFCSYPDEQDKNFIVSIWRNDNYIYQGTITPGRYVPTHRITPNGEKQVRTRGNFAWMPDHWVEDEWVEVEAYEASIEAKIQQHYA